MNFLMGVIFGIILATIGVQGVVNIVDSGVHAVETIAKNTVKEQI